MLLSLLLLPLLLLLLLPLLLLPLPLLLLPLLLCLPVFLLLLGHMMLRSHTTTAAPFKPPAPSFCDTTAVPPAAVMLAHPSMPHMLLVIIAVLLQELRRRHGCEGKSACCWRSASTHAPAMSL